MIIPLNKKHKVIGERNGIKIYKQLTSRKGLNKVSQKQKLINQEWSKITNEKITELGNRCEWCGRLGKRTGTLNFLTGHHKIKRRYNLHTKENCYIVHWFEHQYIEENNINVNIYKNKLEWEKRK
jgi:hypothetical protein